MIMASQAGPVATAIVMTTMARGDHALALVLTLISNAITALLTPIILRPPSETSSPSPWPK